MASTFVECKKPLYRNKSRQLYMKKLIRQMFVSFVYADHNSSNRIKRKLTELLNEVRSETIVLNIGSGNKRLHPNIKNLDIIAGENVDIVGSAEKIPLNEESVDLIITQEAFEHIQDPNLAIKECFRVMKPGGKIYFQVPFVIGYHPGPTDFLRFTKEGVYELVTKAGFKISEIGITVGGATGFYRIAVEFFAILSSGPFHFLYLPMKAVFALILYPIKFLDPWFKLSRQRDRIPGGYFAVAYKPDVKTI